MENRKIRDSDGSRPRDGPLAAVAAVIPYEKKFSHPNYYYERHFVVVVVSSNVKRIAGRISSSDTQGGDESTTTDSRADNTSGNRWRKIYARDF